MRVAQGVPEGLVAKMPPARTMSSARPWIMTWFRKNVSSFSVSSGGLNQTTRLATSESAQRSACPWPAKSARSAGMAECLDADALAKGIPGPESREGSGTGLFHGLAPGLPDLFGSEMQVAVSVERKGLHGQGRIEGRPVNGLCGPEHPVHGKTGVHEGANVDEVLG